MPTIALCMIVKNEENILDQTLNNIKHIVDEIIIVDTGSTDKTKEIAKQFTTHVFDFQWQDSFADARNFSISKATADWILILDADEFIERPDQERIKHIIKSTENAGFAFQQRTYHTIKVPNSLLSRSVHPKLNGYPWFVANNLVRLFRNNKNITFRHRIHETVEDSIHEQGMAFEKTQIVLHHPSSTSITEEKKQYYGKLILKQLDDNPESPRYNYYAGHWYLSIKDTDNALKHLLKTAVAKPHYKTIFWDIACAYMQKDDKEHAIKALEQGRQVQPERSSLANNLAVLLTQENRVEEAKRVLEQQIKRDPSNSVLKSNYQQLLIKCGEQDSNLRKH